MLMVTEGTFRGLAPIHLPLSAALHSHPAEQGEGVAGGGGEHVALCAGARAPGGRRGERWVNIALGFCSAVMPW